MSRVSQVIKNRNRREREAKDKRNQELLDVRIESAYRSKLYEQMRVIDILLDDKEVDAVEVEIPDRYLSQFLKAIYSEEMAEYKIHQIDDRKFRIGRKLVVF